jgi:ribonuclease HI
MEDACQTHNAPCRPPPVPVSYTHKKGKLVSDPNQSPLQVDVYSDGGCRPNPGPGGWGAVIRFPDHQWFLSGNDPDTTNNRMELQAAIAALCFLQAEFGRCTVNLHTDSEYLRQGITEWINRWQATGWKTTNGESVSNQELWQELVGLVEVHQVRWHWLKGHAGHPENERADRLATEARRALRHGQAGPAASGEPAETEVELAVKASYRPEDDSGGWGAVLRKGETTRELSGRRTGTSANALLLVGAAEGLRALTRPCTITVHSDADYLVRGASHWVTSWISRGWRTKDGSPVANESAWKELLQAAEPHEIRWQLTRPDENPDLARAGELAAAASAAPG